MDFKEQLREQIEFADRLNHNNIGYVSKEHFRQILALLEAVSSLAKAEKLVRKDWNDIYEEQGGNLECTMKEIDLARVLWGKSLRDILKIGTELGGDGECLDEEWAVDAGQKAHQNGIDQCEQTIQNLQAENARLRGALERIKGDRPHLAYKELTEVRWRIELADEALKDTPDD